MAQLASLTKSRINFQINPFAVLHPFAGLRAPGLGLSRTPATTRWPTPSTAVEVGSRPGGVPTAAFAIMKIERDFSFISAFFFIFGPHFKLFLYLLFFIYKNDL